MILESPELKRKTNDWLSKNDDTQKYTLDPVTLAPIEHIGELALQAVRVSIGEITPKSKEQIESIEGSYKRWLKLRKNSGPTRSSSNYCSDDDFEEQFDEFDNVYLSKGGDVSEFDYEIIEDISDEMCALLFYRLTRFVGKRLDFDRAKTFEQVVSLLQNHIDSRYSETNDNEKNDDEEGDFLWHVQEIVRGGRVFDFRCKAVHKQCLRIAINYLKSLDSDSIGDLTNKPINTSNLGELITSSRKGIISRIDELRAADNFVETVLDTPPETASPTDLWGSDAWKFNIEFPTAKSVEWEIKNKAGDNSNRLIGTSKDIRILDSSNQ